MPVSETDGSIQWPMPAVAYPPPALAPLILKRASTSRGSGEWSGDDYDVLANGVVHAAEAHFVERGLSRVEVTSGPLHAEAHAFYRHLGYEDQGIRFAKILSS